MRKLRGREMALGAGLSVAVVAMVLTSQLAPGLGDKPVNVGNDLIKDDLKAVDASVDATSQRVIDVTSDTGRVYLDVKSDLPVVINTNTAKNLLADENVISEDSPEYIPVQFADYDEVAMRKIKEEDPMLYEAILEVIDRGIIKGHGKGEDVLTRKLNLEGAVNLAQLVTILDRTAKNTLNRANLVRQYCPELDPNQWFSSPMMWVHHFHGELMGQLEDNCNPERAITVEELIRFAITVFSSFSEDIGISEAMVEVGMNQYIEGINAVELAEPATREMAIMVVYALVKEGWVE